MEVGRDGSRANHGVGEPEVEGPLGGFGHGSEHDEDDRGGIEGLGWRAEKGGDGS